MRNATTIATPTRSAKSFRTLTPLLPCLPLRGPEDAVVYRPESLAIFIPLFIVSLGLPLEPAYPRCLVEEDMSEEDFEILVGSTIVERLDEAELGLVVSAVYLGPHPKVPPDLAMVVHLEWARNEEELGSAQKRQFTWTRAMPARSASCSGQGVG